MGAFASFGMKAGGMCRCGLLVDAGRTRAREHQLMGKQRVINRMCKDVIVT
jgi:hypothetical protein